MAEGGPELEVGVLGEGVEVGANGAFEEVGVLRDDGEAGAEILEADLRDILVVDDYGACAEIGSQCSFRDWKETCSLYVPLEISLSRKSVVMILDFPAPVRPTIPMCSPPLIYIDIPFNTGGRSARYRIWTLEKVISPVAGHDGGIWARCRGASDSSFVP